MDRLTSIEIFVQAVECGSFAAVAEERDISAQMVGKHIRGLEASLGTKLLNKSTRHQSLTPAGEQYYRRCKTILSELLAAENDIHRSLNEPCGNLNIAAGVNFGISFLAPRLAKFQTAHPKMTVNVTLSNQPVDLLKDGFDIMFLDHTRGHESLIAKKIRSYSMVLCASPQYLEQFGFPKHPDDLTHHQCLQHNTSKYPLKWQFYDGSQRYAPEVRSRLNINSSQAMLNAALEGAGITLQPIFQIADELKKGRLIQVLPDFTLEKIDMYIIYPPYLRDTARLNALMAFLEE
ncbi:Transcriptional regulator, LysR family [Photobacterium marinum]|uniref:Transcriptional regulator, LysR family n=1 Tax=Photobacterium marinum TaxID=1056511 RepID=L8JBQ6_9GAMM|nr:LysR family transcriptional regulator [Photobacterium marinum]ELR66245.1 Transcriptional regulator, LysR family [Photobacterium marinum]